MNEDRLGSLQARVIALVETVVQEATAQTAKVTPGGELIRSGMLDSLSLLQLFVRIQEEFQIELDPSCITEENFATPSTIAEMLDPLVNGLD